MFTLDLDISCCDWKSANNVIMSPNKDGYFYIIIALLVFKISGLIILKPVEIIMTCPTSGNLGCATHKDCLYTQQ